MSKMFTISIMMLGMLVLMQFAGIPTGVTTVLNWFGLIDGNISNSLFIVALGGLLAASALLGGGITVGFFTKTNFDYVFLAAFASANLFVFVSVFIAIINYSNGYMPWIHNLMFIIFAILGVAYAWSVVDWVYNRQ